MRITIWGNAEVSNAVTALSTFARLEYPRAIVRARISLDADCLVVDQDEGDSVVHRFERALRELKHARKGVLIELKDEDIIRSVGN